MIVVGFSRELGPAADPFTEETMAFKSKEAEKAYHRKWEKENKEAQSVKKEKWYREHKEKVRKYGIVYRKENSQRIRADKAKWQKKNPEKCNARTREWEQRNPDKVKAKETNWRKNNPDKAKAKMHRRLAKIHGNGGSFTGEEWKALCNKYNHRCLDCGKRKKLEADHIIPVSKGGTSNIDNIQPLCRTCNAHMGTKTTDFRRPHGKR